MKKEDWNEALNHIDSDLVQEFVEESEKIEKRTKRKTVWLRFGAVAASLCLIVGAIMTIPMLHEDEPTSDIPDWRAPDIPDWSSALYSAQDIADLFSMYDVEATATNAYRKIYVPDSQYLPIHSMPDEEYAGIYQYGAMQNPLNQEEFKEFLDAYLPKLAGMLSVDQPHYEIKTYSSEDRLTVMTDLGDWSIYASQYESANRLSFYNPNGNREIVWDGELVQVDQRLSDNEIIMSVEGIKHKLFDFFGVSFTDVKVVRIYEADRRNGVCRLCVYFYNKDAHPLNATQTRPFSDYISIDFDNFENYEGDIVSDTILHNVSISYVRMRMPASEVFVLTEKVKLISLREAEELLYSGYVFGGHICRLCMADQKKVSFEGYDFVDIEYVFGYDAETGKINRGIPFYAFYKQIGKSPNGNFIYAKTYVAAIEVSGYNEYFSDQTKKHE